VSGELANGSEALIHQQGGSSCASSEGPNGPHKGIKGAMTRRNSTTDKRQRNLPRLGTPRLYGPIAGKFEDDAGGQTKDDRNCH
jgi:hypothetical protein